LYIEAKRRKILLRLEVAEQVFFGDKWRKRISKKRCFRARSSHADATPGAADSFSRFANGLLDHQVEVLGVNLNLARLMLRYDEIPSIIRIKHEFRI
jgi:hypothetical protein